MKKVGIIGAIPESVLHALEGWWRDVLYALLLTCDRFCVIDSSLCQTGSNVLHSKFCVALREKSAPGIRTVAPALSSQCRTSCFSANMFTSTILRKKKKLLPQPARYTQHTHTNTKLMLSFSSKLKRRLKTLIHTHGFAPSTAKAWVSASIWITVIPEIRDPTEPVSDVEMAVTNFVKSNWKVCVCGRISPPWQERGCSLHASPRCLSAQHTPLQHRAPHQPAPTTHTNQKTPIREGGSTVLSLKV